MSGSGRGCRNVGRKSRLGADTWEGVEHVIRVFPREAEEKEVEASRPSSRWRNSSSFHEKGGLSHPRFRVMRGMSPGYVGEAEDLIL